MFIPIYGYVCAGLATAISYVVLNLLYFIQLYRQTGIHLFSARNLEGLSPSMHRRRLPHDRDQAEQRLQEERKEAAAE